MSIFSYGANSLTYDGIIRNNLVHDVNVGIGGIGGHIWGYGSGSGVALLNNRAANLIDTSVGAYAQGIYADSYGISNAIVRGNVLDNVTGYNGIGVTNMVMKDNIIHVASGGIGIDFYGQSSNMAIQNLIMNDNVVIPVSGATNTTALSFYPQKATATVRGNVFQGSPPGYDLAMYWAYAPYWGNPGSQIQWIQWKDDINLSGTQLNYNFNPQDLPGDEDSIVFTPTTAGWYRIASASSYAAATIKLESPMWAGYQTTDTEFWFRAAWNTSPPGEIVESRRGSMYWPGNGQVSEARIAADCNGSVFVDIDITNVSGAYPITVTAKGPNRPPLLISPIALTNSPCSSTNITL